MNRLNQGEAFWTVTPQTDGTVSWALKTSRKGEDNYVVKRGTSKNAKTARMDISSLLVSVINGLPVA